MYNIRDNSLPDVQRWRRAYQYDIPVVHLNGTGQSRIACQLQSVIGQTLGEEADDSVSFTVISKEIARHRLPKDVLLARLKELEFST